MADEEEKRKWIEEFETLGLPEVERRLAEGLIRGEQKPVARKWVAKRRAEEKRKEEEREEERLRHNKVGIVVTIVGIIVIGVLFLLTYFYLTDLEKRIEKPEQQVEEIHPETR